MNESFRSAFDEAYTKRKNIMRGVLIWKSVTIRRTILLVLLGIALSATITLSVFELIAPRMFMNAELDELAPRARSLSSAVAAEMRARGDLVVLDELDNLAPFFTGEAMWETQAYLLDINGVVLLPESSRGVNILNESERAALTTGSELASLRQPIREENSPRPVGQFLAAVVVSYNGATKAIVCLLKPMPVVDIVLVALLRTLRLSSILSILLLLPLCALAAIRIVRPIYNVRNVAIRMANGDLDTHVIVRAGGEIGELALALNTLNSRIWQTQDALMMERARVLRILNALDDGILSADEHGVINQINPPMQLALAIRPGDSLPESMMAAFTEAVRSNEQRSFEMPQGQRIWICRVLPLYEQGRAAGAVVVLRDSTQAIRLEQTRRDYVANVSHELRSPLTALRCLLEPLRDGMIASEDKKQEIYETLLRETLRLSRLVDDMLELSRLQSGALALEKTAFSPLILCRQIADMIEPRAAEGGLSILTDLPDELPICFSNPDRIEQVLIALLDNAIKFTPAGGTVSIGARALVDFVEISVSDTGSGIPPVDLPNVFDRFYKADKAHAGHGTGLGLAIARELMSMLGETIGCENLPEGGARFTFTVHIKNS